MAAGSIRVLGIVPENDGSEGAITRNKSAMMVPNICIKTNFGFFARKRAWAHQPLAHYQQYPQWLAHQKINEKTHQREINHADSRIQHKPIKDKFLLYRGCIIPCSLDSSLNGLLQRLQTSLRLCFRPRCQRSLHDDDSPCPGRSYAEQQRESGENEDEDNA